jgi:hypothetical protein
MRKLSFVWNLSKYRHMSESVRTSCRERDTSTQNPREPRETAQYRSLHVALIALVSGVALGPSIARGARRPFIGARFARGRVMNDLTRENDLVDFGELSPAVNELLQKGVLAYRNDRARADELFREALELSPHELPAYYCLYKIHTYMGNLEVAWAVANQGLAEATRQAGWPLDPRLWPPKETAPGSPERFALYTLKALSFIQLKRGNKMEAMENLSILKVLDPPGYVGWTVIYELAQGVA